MGSFTLGSAGETLTLEGEIPRGLTGYDGYSFAARLVIQGLSASLVANDIAPHAWTRYFADLAEHWRGWSGEKVHESLEHHLRIAASCDRRGRVRFRIDLWKPPDDWRVEASVDAEAGSLARLASDAQDFFG